MENPLANTMASRLMDFMRMKPPVHTRSKIAENLDEEFREAMLHDRMCLSRLMVHVRYRKHTRVGNM